MIVEIDLPHPTEGSVEVCDEYDRRTATALYLYQFQGACRALVTVPKDRPLRLRTKVAHGDRWTLRVLPLGHAQRLERVVEGRGPTILIYEGAPKVLPVTHRGRGYISVTHLVPTSETWDDLTSLLREDGPVNVRMPVPGPGLLRVTSDSRWRISVPD